MNKYLEITKNIVLDTIGDKEVTVFLYGSRASQKHSESSDIDIGLIANRKLERCLLVEIKDRLDDSIVPYHIDITDFSNVSADFKKKSLENIILWKEQKSISLN